MELCKTRYVLTPLIVYFCQFYRDSLNSELPTSFCRMGHRPLNAVRSVWIEGLVRSFLLPENLPCVRDTVLGKSGTGDDGTEWIQFGFWVWKQRGETSKAGSHLPDDRNLRIRGG